jgi:uncharacterized membrane protein
VVKFQPTNQPVNPSTNQLNNRPLERIKNILVTVIIALACFAAFITAFESSITVPPWLQVAGRSHPLMVHFPIVLFLLFIGYKLLFKRHITDIDTAVLIEDWLMLLSALSAVVSVIMGLLLSKEAGYDQEAIKWHKWSGIIMAAFMLLWYALHNKTTISKPLSTVFCLTVFIGITVAGHQGADITHGSDYLLEPVKKDIQQPMVLMQDAVVYNNMVEPILQAKCMSCHNSKKAKGQLIMETEALLVKGGKSGSLWDKNDNDLGLLLGRIHLPEDQKKHMPPAGKTQLTDDEISVLTEWIKKGHDFKLKVTDLPPADSLYMLASKMFSSSQTEVYDFAAADEKKIQSLNTENCVVQPIALESPALAVSFFGASLFKTEQLKNLLEIKKQIVSLNLNKIPVKDEDLKLVGQLINLRELNLDFTSITGTGLTDLKNLKELKQLSLSGVPLKETDLKILSLLRKLTHLFVWNTGLKPDEIASLKKTNKLVKFETGFSADTIVLQLTPPILENEEQIITTAVPLRLKHYIKGAIIRYTLDGKDPDSISSPVYDDKVMLDKNATVKAKAYKAGWFGSNILETAFFKNTYPPDSAITITPPDKSAKGNGAITLIDGKKGETNFRSDKWLGYRENKMEMLLSYNHVVTVSSVTLSTIVDIGGDLMPPASIEVWGGDDRTKLKLLGKLTPTQPGSTKPAYFKGYEIKFKPTEIKYIKLVATPLNKLPDWHPGKGEKGWVFADEIFVN